AAAGAGADRGLPRAGHPGPAAIRRRRAGAGVGGARALRRRVPRRAAGRVPRCWPTRLRSPVRTAAVTGLPARPVSRCGRTTLEPAVTIRGLSKFYGVVLALNGLDLELGTGITGLLLPNGAGKSTLLRCLATTL